MRAMTPAIGLPTSRLRYWDQAIAVNLKHQFFMSQAVTPSMQTARRGSIINMSSIGWVIPSYNQVVYVTERPQSSG